MKHTHIHTHAGCPGYCRGRRVTHDHPDWLPHDWGLWAMFAGAWVLGIGVLVMGFING